MSSTTTWHFDEEFVAADFQTELAAHKGEAGAQLQKETGDVPDERVFDVAFVSLLVQTQEVEQVRIFQGLAGELRAGCGEVAVEVGGRRSLAQVKLVLDMHLQRGTRPAVLRDLGGVPGALAFARHLAGSGRV